MGQRAVIPPNYSPDKFVDREGEINLVREKAFALADGHTVDRRVVVFIGGRGTGKTWLLARLQEELDVLSDMQALSFNLKKHTDWEPILAVADVLKSLDNQLGDEGEALGATLADMSRNLMEDVRRAMDHKALALLVDHVYESNWKLLATLEDYLLGPLAVEPRVLIVMTGRARAYPWKTPQLRLKAEFVDLELFPDVTITTEQLERQQKKAVPRASEIHDLSDGNPLANFLLGAYDNPAPALDQVVEGMLETVPKKHRHKTREYCEALCMLRSFDEERIPTMLAAYYDDESYKEWSYTQAREVREELVKCGFAQWGTEQGGYILDAPTRRLLERYLKSAECEKWEKLQHTACNLYEGWARDYPRSRERWQQEAEYHQQALADAAS